MTFLCVILTYFFVSFTDKGGSDRVALGAEALALREQRGIALDSLDYAVCPAYTDSLQHFGVRICHTSRWMNGATIQTSDEKAADIASWSFVKAVEATRFETAEQPAPPKRLLERVYSDGEGDCRTQLELYNLPRLHEAGFRGQGITLAAIDGGFQNLNTLTVFDSMRNEGRLLGAFDFADDETDFYGEGSSHGSRCLGLIAGNRDDYQGAATQVKCYAIRSEEGPTESPKEPDNWIAAVEACDSLGVWIISTSLGYSTFDNAEWTYTYEQLDGKTVRASRAATIAARKGMLLCIAAGNSATTDWPWINVPGDADSVLTVGAVSADSVVTSFSSRGYAADGRVKPDVCAMGRHCCVTAASDDELTFGNGTSFATPLIAGLAACLWSAYPTETNMQIRERIIRSAHHYENPDKDCGYGIPDAWKAYRSTDFQEWRESGARVAGKQLRDGQLIILRDGIKYDILGRYNNTTLKQ